MKLTSLIFVLIVACVVLSAVLTAGGGDYKAYQDRSLTNTLALYRPDLSEEAIAHLVGLPREPMMAFQGDSLFVDPNAEWFLLTDDELFGAHVRGCRGKVVFNIEEASKK